MTLTDSQKSWILLVVGVTMFFGGMYVGYFHPAGEDTHYEYEVKTEQIETDAGYSGDATDIKELPEPYQQALFDAYRESDHFLGGASTEIEKDEKLDIETDRPFQVVEVEGVKLLVGITGPEKVTVVTTIGLLLTFLTIVGFFIAWFGVMAVIERRKS